MPALTPNPQGFQSEIEKDTETPPGVPSAILPLVVIGYCTDVLNAPVNTPQPVSTPGAAKAIGGTGPAVELAACALDNNGRAGLVHLVNVDASNPASYGTITNSFASGTPPQLEGDTVVLPDDYFDVWVRWTVGGTPGTTGIKYRISLDNGLHYFAEQELGTALSIALPNGAGKINLLPPSPSTLYNWANDAGTKLNAHAVYLLGPVHGAADSNAPYAFTVAIDDATLYTLCGELQTAAATHVVITAGGVHGASDTTAAAALAALVVPTTQAEAFAFLIAFTAAFFGNGTTVDSGHTLRTAGGIHGAADTTNTLAALGTFGTITAGDTTSFSTTAPSPNATEIVAAIDSLRTYNGQFGTIALAAPLPAGYINTVYAAIKELWRYNRFPDAVANFDLPGLTETTTAYAARLAADLTGIVAVDFRICSAATYHQSALIDTADGLATPRRPTSWGVAAFKARSEPQRCLSLDTVPIPGVRITNSRGKALPGCLNEQEGILYSVLARTIGTLTDPMRDTNNGVFLTQDLVLYAPNSSWLLGPHTTMVNYALQVAAYVIVKTSAAPNGFQGFGSEETNRLIGNVLSVLEPATVGEGRCKSVQVKIVSTTGGKLVWEVILEPNDYIINGVKIRASILVRQV